MECREPGHVGWKEVWDDEMRGGRASGQEYKSKGTDQRHVQASGENGK